MPSAIHPNLAVIQQLDINNLDACADAFAEQFVWHYFNATWPEIEGDYHGVSGTKEFFGKINQASNGDFEVNPIDVRTVGDELVVTHVRNRLALPEMTGEPIEFDAVVVWRIVDGKIAEAWDIPAVNSVRTERQTKIQHETETSSL